MSTTSRKRTYIGSNVESQMSSWYPKSRPGKWSWPGNATASAMLNIHPFQKKHIPSVWNKLAMPPSLFSIIQGVALPNKCTKKHVVDAMKAFFLHVLENRFPPDEALSPSEIEASAWIRFIMEAFGALIAVANPRYGIFGTSMDTVKKIFPWLPEHKAESFGVLLAGAFQSLQSILANHPGWQELFADWQRFMQAGYAAAPILDRTEALGHEILDVFERSICLPTTPEELNTCNSEPPEGHKPHVIFMIQNFMDDIAGNITSWRMLRRGMDVEHNDLAVTILRRFFDLAAITYQTDAIGDIQVVAHDIFDYTSKALDCLLGVDKDELLADVNKRKAISTESNSLGVLAERASAPITKITEVTAFVSAMKQTKCVVKNAPFLKKLESSRISLWDFMVSTVSSGKITAVTELDPAKTLNQIFAGDHAFVKSVNSTPEVETKDADIFNKLIDQAAEVQIKHVAHNDNLRVAKDPAVTDESLVALRDAANSFKTGSANPVSNLELQTRQSSLSSGTNALIASTGAVGSLLRTDGLTFLKRYREKLMFKLAEAQRRVSGTTDGKPWYPTDDSVFDDKDMFLAHFNSTLGTMQGPTVEAEVDALVTVWANLRSSFHLHLSIISTSAHP